MVNSLSHENPRARRRVVNIGPALHRGSLASTAPQISLRNALLTLLAGFLLAAASLAREVRTVGLDGEFPNVTVAVRTLYNHSARPLPGPFELRVQAGTYPEYASVSLAPGIAVSGGWDETFTTQLADPSATRFMDGFGGEVCDGPSAWFRDLDPESAAVVVSNFTVEGRGVWFNLRHWCSFVAQDVVVEDVENIGGSAPFSLRPEFVDITLRNVVVRDSRTERSYFHCDYPGRSQAVSGGISIDGADYDTAHNEGGHIRLEGVRVQGNQVNGLTCYDVAAAMLVRGLAFAEVTIEDLVATDNRAVVDDGNAGRQGGVLFIPKRSEDWWQEAWTGSIEARRMEIRDNVSPGPQLGLYAEEEVEVVLGDSLVVSGSTFAPALRVVSKNDSSVALTNMTVVGGKIGAELIAADAAAVSLSNSVVTLSAQQDLVVRGNVAQDSSWIGSDPGFLDAAAGNFRVDFNSPAVDGGNDHPVGGLGPADLDGRARRRGSAVDLGAYESHPAQVTCTGGRAVCTCFRDPVLRHMTRCTLELPWFDVWFRFPPVLPGRGTPVEWNILALEDGEWSFESFLDLPSQTLFQVNEQGSLAAGKSEAGAFELDALRSASGASLRSEIVLSPKSAKAPIPVTVEIDLQP